MSDLAFGSPSGGSVCGEIPIPTRHGTHTSTARYARCIEVSKRIRWDIDRDVIRGGALDVERAFMPRARSRIDELAFLSARDARFLSQVQGRSYANMLALVGRFIAAKVLEISSAHWLGDQVALAALVRLADEALKHQELFRRLEAMAAAGMPAGYEFRPDPDDVARVVLSKSTWAALALTLDIELSSQAHYRASIGPDPDLSPLWKDVFLFHWKEVSQHAILDELEWRRVDRQLSDDEREHGVTDLVELAGAVDAICVAQAQADAGYFVAHAEGRFTPGQMARIGDLVLEAYRRRYVVTGATEPRFTEVLASLVSPAQLARIGRALTPTVADRGR